MISMNGGWWAALLALAAAVIVWLLYRERRHAGELRESRLESHALADLLDVWQWRSDAAHHLVQLRPPHGAPAAAWSAAPLGSPLWTRFVGIDEAALRACMDAHAPLPETAVSWQLPDGIARAVLRGAPLADAHGRHAGYLGTLRVLGAAPALRAAPPTAAHADPQHDPERDSFGYTVSHDLRAPIRVVEGFTKILKEDYGRLLDRVGNDHLDRVLGAAARMNCMIDALLALSQLSTQPLARQPVNLSQLAQYIADDLRRQSPEREVAIHIEPDLEVHGDPTLLRVALENLLGNAWKYTGKRRDPQIWLGRDGDAFAVRDNGAGFDMRFADRLFGVFQRLHSASDFQGTGVGLASVRRIVRRHGGDIWADAEVDRGASFHFTLP